jgi:hypothetical protein
MPSQNDISWELIDCRDRQCPYYYFFCLGGGGGGCSEISFLELCFKEVLLKTGCLLDYMLYFCGRLVGCVYLFIFLTWVKQFHRLLNYVLSCEKLM